MRIYHLRNILLILLSTVSLSYATDYKRQALELDKNLQQTQNSEEYKKLLESSKKLQGRAFSRAEQVRKDNQAALNALKGVSEDSFESIDGVNSLREAPLNQLLIFISSSVPKKTLESIAIQARRVGGVLVMRGLIDNSFKKTVSFIKELNEDGVAAVIDPKSFKMFDVKVVPQIIVIGDNNECKWGSCSYTPVHDRISGNISLRYALQTIAKSDGDASKVAERYLGGLQ